MKRLLALTALLAALAAAPAASSHAAYVSPTGWPCYSPGAIKPYAPGYYLYCGTDYRYYLVHPAH